MKTTTSQAKRSQDNRVRVTDVRALSYAFMWRIFYSDGTSTNFCAMHNDPPKIGDSK